MKKLMTIMALAALTLAAAAQENDTVVIHNPRKVTIVTGDSLQRIIVSGKEGDDKFTYQNTIRLVDSNYVSTTRIGRESQHIWASASRLPPRPMRAPTILPSSRGRFLPPSCSGTTISSVATATPCR